MMAGGKVSKGGLAAIAVGSLAAIGGLGWWAGSDFAAPDPIASPSPAPSVLKAPPDPIAGLAAAERAAFPEGMAAQTDAGSRIEYQQGTLVDAPFGPVLVNEGRVANAAHVDPGYVAVHYLRRAGAGFEVAKAYPQAVKVGSFGQMAEMAVSPKFSDLPVVYAEGGGTWQGYTCGWTTLTELRPEGPVELVTFMDSYSNEGAEGGDATEGKIADIVPGRSFKVRFTGTRPFVATYVRRGNKYELEGGEANALQGC
jgi:hypothetical protein